VSDPDPSESPPPVETTRALGAETIGGSLWTAGSTVASAILSAASTVIVARALDSTVFGRYNYLFYIVVLVTKLADFGITARITNALVIALPLGQLARVRAEMRLLLRFGLVKAVALAIFVAALLHRDPVAAAIGGVGTFLQIATSALSTAILAQKRFRLLSLAALGVTVAQSVLTSWVALATSSAELTLAVFLGGQVVTAVIGIAFAPWSVIWGKVASKRVLPSRRDNLSAQLALYAFGVCQLIVFGKSETIVLGYTDQAVALGLFAIATTVAARATLLMDSLHGALLPGIGEASTRDREAVGRAYSTSIRFSSLLVLITALVLGPPLVVYGPVILGADGAAVQIACAVTLAGSLLQSFVYPLTVVASVEVQRRAIMIPSVIGAAVDVAAAVALVPAYGIYGAMTASVLAAVTYAGILCWIVEIPPSARRTLWEQSARVVAIVGLLAVLGGATAQWSHGAAVAAVGFGVVVAYAAAAYGSGVLVPSDLAALKAAIPGNRSVPISLRRAATRALLVRFDAGDGKSRSHA
jgi:O-antigen/teichoic acid export membrane protein